MSIKSAASNTLGIFWGILSTLSVILWPMGLYHTAKHHSRASFYFALFPPIGDYFGLESFWHKERPSADVEANSGKIDWVKRIPDDMSTACQLLLINDNTVDIDNTRMQIESFGKKMDTYPLEKKREIEKGVSTFLRCNLNTAEDLNKWLVQLLKDTTLDFKYSPKTVSEYDSLINYFKIPIGRQMKELNDSALNEFNFKLLNADQLRQVITSSKAKYKVYGENYHIAFKSIFKEDFIE